MKKLIPIILLVFFALSLKAQDIKTIDTTKYVAKYKYTYSQDSLNTYIKKDATMILQIGKRYSKFVSLAEFNADSISYQIKDINDDELFRMFVESQKQNSSSFICGYSVFKNYPNPNQVTLTSMIDKLGCVTIERKEYDWCVLPGTDTIINLYKCKKAITKYAGRKYSAWFTVQIPISDGPYKFFGLPGLIVKLEDSKKEHCFTLERFGKNKSSLITYILGRDKELTPQQYTKALSAKMQNTYQRCANDEMIKFVNEDKKIDALNNVKSKNNFIEKY